MKHARYVRLVQFGIALGTLTIATFFAGTLEAQTPAVVRVVGLPTDVAGNLYFALDRGFFKDAGLDVQIQAVQNGSAAAAALASGQIDVAQSTVSATAAAHLHGVDLKFFAPAAVASSSAGTDAVFVPNDSPAKVAADLNGKTIGIVAVKTIQQVMAMGWTDKHGGDSKTLKFVEIPYPQMGAALSAHRVDAVIITEPFLSMAKSDGRSIGDPVDGIAPRFIPVAWIATTPWLADHRDVAARFAAAITKAGLWANTHHAESADILAKYSGLNPEIAHTMPRATFLASIDPALVQVVIDASVKYGALDRSFPAAEIIASPN